MSESTKDQLDRIELKIDLVEHWISNKEGANVRLDRLEQDALSQKWWRRITITTAATAVLAVLFKGI